MASSAGHFYEFGPFRVDVANLLLFRDGQPLSLAPKAVETLIALVQHGGQLVKKDDLLRIVWSDRVVDESNLSQNIYLLRKTLGEGSNGQRYIETVPRRGYRFVGEVRESVVTGTDLILAERPGIQTIFEPARDAASAVARSDERSLSGRPVFPLHRLLAPAVNRRWRVSTLFLFGTAIIVVAAAAYQVFFKTPKLSETKASLVSARESAALTADRFGEQHLTASPDAYHAYIQGRYYWSKETTPALEQAIQQFQEALRNDPNYPLSYAGLAEAYALLGSHYDSNVLTPGEAMFKAKTAAERAIELNDSLAEVHTALGAIKARYDWDWPGAEKEFKRAIELNPNYAHAHQAYALDLSAAGRTMEAQAEIKRAQALDPASLSIGRDMGDLYYLARDYDQSLEQYRRTLKLDPTDPVAISVHRAMAWAYEFHGMHEQAIAEFIEMARIQNASPERLSAFRKGYDAGGMKGYFRAWLEVQRERIDRGRISPFYLAQVYAFIGDRDRAFASLQRAREDHCLDVPALRSSPDFDDLRKDPGFVALLERIGLKS
jgi:DNA-binding winged helix-turn-helix (wHTH) protein/tetratricopeptide (TPR) repeat protein